MTGKFKKTMLPAVAAVLVFGMTVPAAANVDTLSQPEQKVMTVSTDNVSTDMQKETVSDSTTDAVNNSTALPDGSYTPDSFSFSGGTGKVRITCPSVRVEEGQAYAEIRFSSSKYGYVKANAETYYPISTEDGSLFEIPIELNKNNKILAMTTAMSSAHEIEYTIYVYIGDANAAEAAGSDDNGKAEGNEIVEAAGAAEGNTAPEIIGLTASDKDCISTPYLKMYYYEGDIVYAEIDISDTDALAERENGLEDDSTEAGLYQNDILKYLIVPAGVEIPAGLEKEIIIINLPKEQIYVQSDEAENILKTLNADSLSDDAEGTYEEPDYKSMIKNSIDLAVISSEFLRSSEDGTSSETSALYNTFTDRMETLGIPVIIDRISDAVNDADKAAWRIFYSLIFENGEYR